VTALPRRADVVVIGGGIVGVCAALALRERGLSVTLCEKGRVAGEQSSRNWGWVRTQGRDPRELPLMLAALRDWERLAQQVDCDIGFRRAGATYLCETEAQLAQRAAWMPHARAFGLPTRMLSAAETDALLGRDDRRFKGAQHTATDAMAEPSLAVPALARLAAAQGAQIVETCAVRTLDRVAGRVRGVVTEHGAIACDAVILAGGVWSRPFLENAGLSLPQLAITASVLRTGPAPLITPGPLGADAASLRRRADGGYTIARSGAARFDLIPAAFAHFPTFARLVRDRWGILKLRAGPAFFGPLGRRRWAGDQVSPFEQVRMLDPAPDAALLADVLRAAQALHPALRGVGAAASWGGMIDVTPDEGPVIDALPDAPGLTLATGFSGHGFGLGPAAGRLAADLATGAAPVVDPHPFRRARFS